MVVGVDELIEVITKMVYKECSKRNICVDEDILHDVFVKVWKFVKNHREIRKTWTGYVWRVVNSVLNDLLRERYEWSRFVYFEDMKGEDESESKFEEFLVDRNGESFSNKLLKVVEKYSGLVGEDFLKLVIGDMDVSNALKSVQLSRKKGVEWIEWWLQRKLSEEEVRCCEDIKAIL
jgi:DNA-directed RNA polymerase specialized sigma24 family protein